MFNNTNIYLRNVCVFVFVRWKELQKDEINDDAKPDIYMMLIEVIDLSNKKATDMRSNQRVKLVDPEADDEKEVKRDNLKLEILNTYSNIINKKL